ncbi:MAG: HEAT repeat domain-containing protein [Deltaproteobacteria bacterium]|nr:HEAT repeat domain-containing protein [Deltaproteobacteria bacterium]
MSPGDGSGLAARLRRLSRQAGDLVARSVGSAARAGRAAGRALTPDPQPPRGTAVVERLDALASRLQRLEATAAGAPSGTLADRLGVIDRLLREAAALSAALAGPAAEPPLPPIDPSSPVVHVARQALAALAARGAPASPGVARAIVGLAHPRAEIRQVALEFLGDHPEPLALPLLEALYQRAPAAERRLILAAARHVEPGWGADRMIQAALGDADPGVRLTGVRAVARGSKLPAELDALAANDPRPEVRRASLQTLLESETPRRGVRVEQGLRDPEARVRLETVRAAAASRDPAVVLPLMRALFDDDEAVRGAAAAALGEVTGLDVDFDPAAPAAERRQAASRLRQQWGKARFQHLPGAAVEDETVPLGDDELARPLEAEFVLLPRAGRSRPEPR